ncbi:MAG: four helix bundle protein [Pseudomonadota bacterium]
MRLKEGVSRIESYQDLLVWQRSMGLVELVYRLSNNLPIEEKFGLIPQMCRAAVSIPSNIAEGYGRQASGEYRHHLSIARGSLLELETQIILCQRLGFLSKNLTIPILTEITELSKMLATIIGKLR